MGDGAGGPPRHVQEPADRLLVGDGHQPRALRLEIPGEPASRLRPRHLGDDHAALRAVHARHVGDQLDPEAAEVLMTPTAHAAATVIARALPPAAGASEHARARAHADLEHGLGTHGAIDDAHGFDDHAFDVEETFEYAVHQALCGCLFILVENILPGKRSSLTPPPNTSTTNHHPRKQQ